MLRFGDKIKNIAKLSFGTILGQIISIISLPIYTRIYGIEIIGQWTLVNSISIIINSFSDLGLLNSIMLEDNDEGAIKTYQTISTISMIITFLSCIIYFLYYFFLNKNNYWNIFSTSILIFLWSFTLQQIQLCYTWLNRKKKYNVLMKNPVLNNLTMSVISIFLGVLGFKNFGYFVGMLFGQFVTLIHMKIHLPKKFITINLNQIYSVIKQYNSFVIYQLPSTVLLQFKSQLPTLLFSTLFGNELLGYYSIAMRLLNIPTTFLANSIGKVYFQNIADLKNDLNLIGHFTLKSLNYAMKCSVFPLALILSCSDILLITVFGSDYVIAGNFTRLMTIYGFFMFLSMSTSGVAIVINKQKYLLVSGVFQILGIMLSFYFGACLKSTYIALIFMSVSYIIIQIIYFCNILKSTGIRIILYIVPLMRSIFFMMILYIIIRIFLIHFNVVSIL